MQHRLRASVFLLLISAAGMSSAADRGLNSLFTLPGNSSSPPAGAPAGAPSLLGGSHAEVIDVFAAALTTEIVLPMLGPGCTADINATEISTQLATAVEAFLAAAGLLDGGGSSSSSSSGVHTESAPAPSPAQAAATQVQPADVVGIIADLHDQDLGSVAATSIYVESMDAPSRGFGIFRLPRLDITDDVDDGMDEIELDSQQQQGGSQEGTRRLGL